MTKKAWIYDYDYQNQIELANIFPETNYLLQLCSNKQQPILHFWQTLPTVILGLQDKHLADLPAGISLLHDFHYHAFIRNSGGLAVISEPGILNISFFIPQKTSLTIDQAYQQAFDYLQAAFGELNLEHYQVEHSYCPGDYDIVVQGQKIGGIAQRRQHEAVVVMIYLSVNGNQPARGQLLQQFYQAANTTHNDTYPLIWPETMANIQDFLSTPITVNDCKKRLLAAYKATPVDLQVLTPQLLKQQPDFQTIINKEHAKQQRLNKVILEENN